MACFVVPVAEAVVASVASHILESKEKNSDKTENTSVKFSKKVKWLSKLLWGGSFLLAFEHVWHGEIKPFFPFLTAAESPESFTAMLNEVSTVGVGMALTVTAAWVGMLVVSGIIEKRQESPETVEEI